MKLRDAIAISFVLFLIPFSSCRTLDRGRQDSYPNAAKQGQLVYPKTGGYYLKGIYYFAEKESEVLYKNLSKQELQLGLKVPDQTLHTSRGTVRCQTPKNQKRICNVHLKSSKPNVNSQGLPLSADHQEEVSGYLQIHRNELLLAESLWIDIFCDFIGPQTPPYNRRVMSCKLQHPRLPNETIFEGSDAQELSSLLSGGHARPTSLQGTLRCQDSEQCFIKPHMAMPSSPQPLEKKIEVRFSRVISQRLRDTQAVAAPALKNMEISGAILCEEDKNLEKILGRSQYVCRIKT